MKLTAALLYITVANMFKGIVVDAQGQMVKMCLFYDSPSGHARSDPIIDQQCASGHVHTFYGPQDFHPNTSYEDLIATSPQFSTSPFQENQSLYWHPSIYRVTENGDGTETFTRVNNLESSPYYRWDNSVFDDNATPKTEAFPPHFRYIAASSDPGANNGGENEENVFTECCNIVDGEEDCISWNRLEFPTQTCDFLGIALAGPTCWNGDLGITNDHKSHMAYTLDGEVAGECPTTHPRRLPQVQLFVRVPDYQGGKYQLSDSNTEFHFDFFNGWQEGKLQEIIDNCMPQEDQEIGEYNPECDCTSGDDAQTFLTPKEGDSPGAVCDNAVRRLILNEATDVTTSLPKDACQGPPLIPKSWDTVTSDLYSCEAPPTGTPVPPTPVPPTPVPPVSTPVPPTPAPPTPVPEPPEEEEEESLERWVVCGRGVGDGLRSCPEGEVDLVSVDEVHEVRCCVYEDDFWEAFDEDPFDEGWKQKCRDDEFIDVLGKSMFGGECFEENFNTARSICDEAGGRLCSAEELLNSCTKGTGCRHDREMIWTCTEEYEFCESGNECCSGICSDNECEPW